MFTKTSIALIIVIAAASGALAETKKQGVPFGSGGFSTGPYHQGTPADRLPIWRGGYYQGNDPDQNIRVQLMRDGTNTAH
jgi:hypothetical protein